MHPTPLPGSALPHPAQATLLLQRAASGDRLAADQLLPVVYEQLRTLASNQFSTRASGAVNSSQGTVPGHTLQPTALVHEAYVRLIRSPDGTQGGYESRGHFMAVAAMAMRQILADHARRKRTAKRGGDAQRIDITFVEENIVAKSGRLGNSPAGLDVEHLDDVLAELERLDDRRHRVVCLRFFGGLEMAEVARVMDVSLSTVEADWRSARAWLAMKLKK